MLSDKGAMNWLRTKERIDYKKQIIEGIRRIISESGINRWQDFIYWLYAYVSIVAYVAYIASHNICP